MRVNKGKFECRNVTKVGKMRDMCRQILVNAFKCRVYAEKSLNKSQNHV